MSCGVHNYCELKTVRGLSNRGSALNAGSLSSRDRISLCNIYLPARYTKLPTIIV